jgi:hypothetical protein
MPVFKVLLTDDQDHKAPLTGSEPSSPYSSLDNKTKKSFDFTGEINKLNASGKANRLSFLEQLEKAFPDPKKLQSFDIDPNFALPSFTFKFVGLTPETSVNQSVDSIKPPTEARREQSTHETQYVEPTQFEDVAKSTVLSPPIRCKTRLPRALVSARF